MEMKTKGFLPLQSKTSLRRVLFSLGFLFIFMMACSLTQPLEKTPQVSTVLINTTTPTLDWLGGTPMPSITSSMQPQTLTKAAALGTVFPSSTLAPQQTSSYQPTRSITANTPGKTVAVTVIKFPTAAKAWTRTSIYYRSRTPTRTVTQPVKTATVTPTATGTPTATTTGTVTLTPTASSSPTRTATLPSPTPSPTATATPEWIVFSAPGQSGEASSLWKAGLYGSAVSGQALLYSNADGSSLGADISPDGSTLLFEGVCGTPAAAGLCILDLSDTAEAPVLINSLPDGTNRSPSLSQDGKWAVFSNEKDGNTDLYMIDLQSAGSLPLQLTSGTEMDSQPHWGNGGIVFIRDGDPMIIRIDETFVPGDETLAEAVFTSPEAESDPSLSPDGSMLAFSRLEDGDWEICLYAMGTGEVTILTDNLAADRQPDWSADGAALLFISDRDQTGVFQLYRMTASGADQLRLNNTLANESDPFWIP